MIIQRAKNASRNFIFGIINKMVLLFLPFILRTVIIYILGVEYVGLNSLFSSILQVLNLAELGFGAAVVFSMYSAIANDDNKTICALLNYYKKVFRIVGLIITIVGLCIIPFLQYIVSSDVPPDINIYVLYLIVLSQTSISYFLFAYRNCIFTAYQRSDISSNISSFVNIMLYALQIIFLLIFKNYYFYVIFLPFSTVINNLFILFFSKKKFPNIVPEGELDNNIKKAIYRKIKSIFWYKIGSVVLTSVDTIIISAFLGLKVLGIYNNYYYIITTLFGFIAIIYTGIVAGIGNSLQVDSYEKNKKDFDKLFIIQSWIVGWFSICLLCLYQPFMERWVGEDNLLPFGIVILLVVQFFIWKMMDVVNVYKEANGMWEYDKFRPLVASLVNLISNLILVNFIGIYGIVLSTILSIFFVIFPWSTFVLFKYLFNKNLKKDLLNYFMKYFVFTLITCCTGVLTYFLCDTIRDIDYLGICIRAVICIIVPNIVFLFVFSFSKNYCDIKGWIFEKIRNVFSRGKRK